MLGCSDERAFDDTGFLGELRSLSPVGTKQDCVIVSEDVVKVDEVRELYTISCPL